MRREPDPNVRVERHVKAGATFTGGRVRVCVGPRGERENWHERERERTGMSSVPTDRKRRATQFDPSRVSVPHSNTHPSPGHFAQEKPPVGLAFGSFYIQAGLL